MQVKEAVQRAKEYLPEIFEAAEGKELQLEAVERSNDGSVWAVAFSFAIRPGRDYKTVRLKNADGEFLGASNGVIPDAL